MGNKTSEDLFHVNLYSLSLHVSISSTVFSLTALLCKRWPVWSEVIAGWATGPYRWKNRATAVDRMDVKWLNPDKYLKAGFEHSWVCFNCNVWLAISEVQCLVQSLNPFLHWSPFYVALTTGYSYVILVIQLNTFVLDSKCFPKSRYQKPLNFNETLLVPCG